MRSQIPDRGVNPSERKGSMKLWSRMKGSLGEDKTAAETKRLQWESIISELAAKKNVSDEQVKATNEQLSQLEKKYAALLKVFKEGFELVKQQQSELGERLELGMQSHQEIQNRMDALSSANVQLGEKLLHVTQALGEKEEWVRSYRSGMEIFLQEVKTRIGDFESTIQSIRAGDRETEARMEQLAGQMREIEDQTSGKMDRLESRTRETEEQRFGKMEQESQSRIEELASQVRDTVHQTRDDMEGLAGKVRGTEEQFSHLNRMNAALEEKWAALAKTLDENGGLLRAYQKETGEFVRDLTDKMAGLALQGERFQGELREAASQRDVLHETLGGIRETIDSLRDDFARELHAHRSGLADQLSAFRAKLDDQNAAHHQWVEKSGDLELQLKAVNDRWGKLEDQQFAKYGKLLDMIDGVVSRVQILEDQLRGIRESEDGTRKSVQDLSREFSVLQRDLQSLGEDVRIREQQQRVVENKLGIVRKIIDEAASELEGQRNRKPMPVPEGETAE